MKNKNKYYRTTVTVTVLSEEPFTTTPELNELHYAITDGDCSGDISITKQETLNGKQIAKALQDQGSDPGFFNLTDEGEEA